MGQAKFQAKFHEWSIRSRGSVPRTRWKPRIKRAVSGKTNIGGHPVQMRTARASRPEERDAQTMTENCQYITEEETARI